jgi:hypothetical protein
MADTRISALVDGVAAQATDRIPIARSPFGAGDNAYLTPAYIKDYILGLANTWTQKQTVTPPANTEAIVVSGYSLTGANAQSLLDLSGTWNTTGTPSAIKLNITDTASNANSLLVDLQKSGSAVVRIDKDGRLALQGSSVLSTHVISFATDNKRIGSTSNYLWFSNFLGGLPSSSHLITSGNFAVGGDTLGFGGGGDTFLRRAVARVIAFETASNAGATFRAIATTPAQITADQNNYNPGGVSRFQRWSSDASRNVTE